MMRFFLFFLLLSSFIPAIADADDALRRVWTIATFAIGKIDLPEGADALISQAAEVCTDERYQCWLEGTADEICNGTPNPDRCQALNGRLASERAIVVRDKLVSTYSVNPDHILQADKYETRAGLRQVRIVALRIGEDSSSGDGGSADAGKQCSTECNGTENFWCLMKCVDEIDTQKALIQAVAGYGALPGQPKFGDDKLAERCLEEGLELNMDLVAGTLLCDQTAIPEYDEERIFVARDRTDWGKLGWWSLGMAALAGGFFLACEEIGCWERPVIWNPKTGERPQVIHQGLRW